MKKKILFSLISLILFFLIIEIIFRVIFYVKFNKYHTTAYIQGSSLQMSDDNLIFGNRPFYLDKNKKYQFNEEGFKSRAGDTKMPVKSANDFWVFLFGASAMEGMGSNKDGEWLDITGVPDYAYDSSIVSVLQRQLQTRMPGKKVSVFCAANSGFSVYQSMLQYDRLRSKYKMDFVISIDGVNEPLMKDKGSSERDIIQKNWNDYPIFKSPLKYIIPVTQHSVFINSLKQSLFESKMDSRLKMAAKNNYPARTKWLAAASVPLLYNGDSMLVQKSVDSFFYYMKLFDRKISADNISHFLFVQPHLTLRDTTKISSTEKALFHYYELTDYNYADFNLYMKEINQKIPVTDSQGTIRSLDFMHKNDFGTFVDYCHLSAPAIRQLAVFFADCIVSTQHP